MKKMEQVEKMECVTTHLPNELNLEMDGAQEEGEGGEDEDGEEGENIDRNFLKHSPSSSNNQTSHTKPIFLLPHLFVDISATFPLTLSLRHTCD
jgi:hypothetical protein